MWAMRRSAALRVRLTRPAVRSRSSPAMPMLKADTPPAPDALVPPRADGAWPRVCATVGL